MKIDNNVFYECTGVSLNTEFSKEYKVHENLFVSSKEGPGSSNDKWDPVAFIYAYSKYDAKEDNISVRWNIG